MINGFGDAAAIERECEELGAIHDGADMSKPAEIERMMKRCADELGGPDILVNNAGIQHVSPVEEFPAREVGRDHRHQPVRRRSTRRASLCPA